MNQTLYFTDKKLNYLELRYSKSNNCYKEHIHNTLSIGAILNGKRIYINKNKTFILQKKQLAIVNPNTSHSCNNNTKSANKLYIAYADHIRTASRLTSGHSAEVDSYTLPIYIRTI